MLYSGISNTIATNHRIGAVSDRTTTLFTGDDRDTILPTPDLQTMAVG